MSRNTPNKDAAPAASSLKKKEDKVLVTIPKPRNMVGDTETVVSINGEMYQIMYDRPVLVPRNVAEVIQQSQELQAKIEEQIEAAVMRPGKGAIAEL